MDTHRGIVDNLTSQNNKTESLSAHQGYLLANGSARDSTKLALSGGSVTGTLRLNKDTPSGTAYNSLAMEVRSSGGSPVGIGFHRGGYTQTILAHEGSGLVVRTGNISTGALAPITASSFIGNATTATTATTATNATNINTLADNSSNAARFILFSDAAAGNQRAKTDTGLKYNPSSNTITATLAGNATSASSATTSNRLDVPDTRSVVVTPTDLPRASITAFFKTNAIVNAPPVTTGASYAHILNMNGYTSGNSGGGGHTTQLAFGDSLAIRQSTSTTAWGAWTRLALVTDNVATATALTTNAGSKTQPIYFSGGKPVATTYSLGKSVPSTAVFTDTH